MLPVFSSPLAAARFYTPTRYVLRCLCIASVLCGISAAGDSLSAATLTAVNGTSVIMKCEPAEQLVRTHMAPDFESPQLIRKLDWLHEGLLIASYQQGVLSDSSRQWMVSDRRFQLVRPFYSLHLSTALPQDSGVYHCRLETDPLFALTESSGSVTLVVMVRPPAPSKAELTSYTERSVTLSWKQTASEAHRPILQYSVVVRSLKSKEERSVTLRGNGTSAVVSGLLPLTQYAFSVVAYNAAGSSDPSPRVVYRTLGEAPQMAPVIESVRNTSEGCVNVTWKGPSDGAEHITGYRVMVHRMGTGTMREWHTQSTEHSLCNLPFNSAFIISIEADNGYGYSPSASNIFYTDQSVPDGPPESVRATALSSTVVTLSWENPQKPNGVIIAFQIYVRRVDEKSTRSIRLKVRGETSVPYFYNVTDLVPFKEYAFRISAFTSKGEGDRSEEVKAITDHGVPSAPRITNITYNCQNAVTVVWTGGSSPEYFYHMVLEGTTLQSFNTTRRKVELSDLTTQQRYSIKVSSVVRSVLHNSTVLVSQWSPTEVFLIAERCSLHSSLCSSSAACERLAVSPSSSFSVLIASFAVLIAIALTAVAAVIVKKRCVVGKKKFLKEEAKFCDEAKSLVYDPKCGETVSVDSFDRYCQELAQNDNFQFQRQFENIEKDSLMLEEFALKEHRSKDRYLNICALESTRIKIASGSSDYINANYVDSCENQRAYIATQAPLPHTFADFWEMVWQEQCNVIVVITNLVEHGRRKCDQYWPSSMVSLQTHGQFSVNLDKERANAHFVHRVFTLRMTKCLMNERKVHHLHFTSWPDHGVPHTVFPLLSFLTHVSEIPTTGPIVVHCSAGVGRSGSFMLVDSMRRHLLLSDSLNVEAHLRHIRQQRAKLVQTLEQYIFCHEAIRQLIIHGVTRVHVTNFMHYTHNLFNEIVDDRSRLQMQYEDACRCQHTPRCSIPVGYQTFPGFHKEDEFIVATWPHETCKLWELAWEKSCQTIVLLGANGNYWRNVEAVGDLKIERTDEDAVIVSNKEDQLCVRVLCVSQCDFELDTWTEIERVQQRRLQYHESPLLVLNPQASSVAYMLCLLTSVACQVEAESCLDVLQFLSSYKYILCNVWSTQCDVEIIYDKLLILVQSLQHGTAC